MATVDYSIPQVRHKILVDAEVTEIERLSHTMLRLRFYSDALKGQDAISCADTYMKLVLPARPGSEDLVMRSYTVRRHNPIEGTVDVDFALHGQGGVAAQWALSAQVGDKVTFKGIGGGYNPSPQAPWHLFIGDDSALPAIAAAVEKLESSALARVILVGESEESLLGAGAHPGYDLPPLENLELDVVQNVDQVIDLVSQAFASHASEATPHVFLHGEAGLVRAVRKELRVVHCQSMKSMSVSGYWRAGATDEMWREIKREWSQAQESEEAQLMEAIAR